MTLPTTDELLADIERHLSETRQSAAAFGRAVSNDASLVLGIRRGRIPSLNLAKRIVDTIEYQKQQKAS